MGARVEDAAEEIVRRRVADLEPDRGVERGELDEIGSPKCAAFGGRRQPADFSKQLGDRPDRGEPQLAAVFGADGATRLKPRGGDQRPRMACGIELERRDRLERGGIPARTAQQQVTAPLEHDEGGRRVGAVFAEQPAPGGRWRRRDRGLARERRGEDEPGGTGVQPKIGHGAKD